MLKLLHSSTLSIHLLKAVVFCEFLGHLKLELLLHSQLLCAFFGLESLLVLLGGLKLLLLILTLLSLGALLGLFLLLHLLHLQFVSKIFKKLGLSSTFGLLSSQFVENSIAHGFSSFFGRCEVVCTLLLLTCMATDQLLFVLLQFFLSFE